MVIGGFQKFSLSDFPGKISAIVFTRGCNFRCPYCHNPELVDPESYASAISEETVITHLQNREGRIQGVVVTGGEPTQHEDLPEFLERVKDVCCAVKLDTNGSNPALLERIVSSGLVDFIALDVKAPLPRYQGVVRIPVDTTDVLRSIRLVIESSIPHEMRTTYVEPLLSLDDMREIAETVRGCKVLVVQRFRPTKALDPGMLEQPTPSAETMEKIRAAVAAMGISCEIR